MKITAQQLKAGIEGLEDSITGSRKTNILRASKSCATTVTWPNHSITNVLMLTYDLCLALKQAGFPQHIIYSYTTPYGGTNEMNYEPSLSELIEACGDRFAALQQDKEEWRVYMWDSPDMICFQMGVVRGKSPEEAVAKLYLKLNEPKTSS